MSIGGTNQLAADAAGVSIDSLDLWKRTFPEFAEEIQNAKGRAATGRLAKMVELSDNGNFPATRWLIERLYPEYNPRSASVNIDFGRNAANDDDDDAEDSTVPRGSSVTVNFNLPFSVGESIRGDNNALNSIDDALLASGRRQEFTRRNGDDLQPGHVESNTAPPGAQSGNNRLRPKAGRTKARTNPDSTRQERAS